MQFVPHCVHTYQPRIISSWGNVAHASEYRNKLRYTATDIEKKVPKRCPEQEWTNKSVIINIALSFCHNLGAEYCFIRLFLGNNPFFRENGEKQFWKVVTIFKINGESGDKNEYIHIFYRK